MAELRNYFPAWRVFIFGQDVTEDVTRVSLTGSGSESRGPSVAEIEMVNGGSFEDEVQYRTDRYIVTEQDIAVLYGEEAQLSEIKFPDEKEIYRDILDTYREADEAWDPEDAYGFTVGQTEAFPNLQSALAVLRPSLVTGDPVADDRTARGLIQNNPEFRGLSEEEFRREAARRAYSRERAYERYATQLNEAQIAAAARQDELDRIIRDRIRARILDPVKQAVLEAKFDKRQESRLPTAGRYDPYSSRSIQGLQGLTGQVLRYPYHVGDSIFHSNDPVRIFWRDPSNPQKWYHMFAGFVSDTIDDVDQNDTRIVRFRAEDASRILRYARITANPGVLDIDDVRTVTDAVTRTFYNSNFANLTLPEYIFGTIFGAELIDIDTGTADIGQVRTFANTRISVRGSTTGRLKEDAIGAYNYRGSFVAVVGENAAQEAGRIKPELNPIVVASLGEYQALVDHQVYESDLDNMAFVDDTDGRVVAEVENLKRNVLRVGAGGDPDMESVVKIIGENPHLFPVDYGRVIMLVPASLGPGTNTNTILRDIASVVTQTTWQTRLGLIYDMMERIDYQFYATPRGDLVCEMPLYDFEPDDFGNTPVDMQALVQRIDATRIVGGGMRFSHAPSDRHRGPYAQSMRVSKSDTIRWERTFSDEAVRTQLVSTFSLIPGYETLPSSGEVGINIPINLYGLVPQFGVRSASVDPRGIITTEESAKLYAAFKLNQINSNAKKANVDILPRVHLMFPNRPVEFEERRFIGTIERLRHSIVWGKSGEMTTGLEVKYIRAWGGQVTADGRPVYEPIGGFASQDFNYALRLGFRYGDSIESSKRRG